MLKHKCLIVAASLLIFVDFVQGGNNCLGCTQLDSLTLDKMLNHFRVSLVKIDVPYPYGKKQVI